MSIDLDQFHDVFFAESFEALDTMEAALLKLEPGTPDPETINTIFRVAHSIKGGSGMFGFAEITAFTHTLETLLDELRAGKLPFTAEMADSLLQSVDQLRQMLQATSHHQPLDLAVSQQLQVQFRQWVSGDAPAAEKAADAAVVAQAVAATPAAPAADKQRWQIGFRALPELLKRGNDPLRIFEELAGLGELEATADCSAVPALLTLDPAHCHVRWELLLTTSAPREAIDLIFEWAEGDCELAIERAKPAAQQPVPLPLPIAQPQPKLVEEAAVATPAPTGSTPVPPRSQASAGPDANSIRVAIEKIDELLNTVGEIVITQSMLGQLALRFEGVHADRLRSGLGQLDSNIRELQESVMRIRMLPVGSVFSRFPRLVRDLSTRLGKQIRLQITGEQTELDKTVLEKIGDPLVHLIRNSIDHGIELPADRLAAGKPAEGVVHLNAFHKGGSINIVITDDGKGLDKDRIVDKARAKGLVDAGATLTDKQVYDLIFLPGFSTAAQTTDLSGRGVGMDVVRRNIKELGGTVELRSVHGMGTTTTITLPLTLAIVDGQSVAVGTETYIVPLVTIVESLQLKPGTWNCIQGHGEVFSFRGDYLPVIRLHELFGVQPRCSALHEGLIMVVEGDGQRAGLFIDELLGQQQVVIKSMESNYRRTEGVGGATILGEGTVALILDIPGMLRMAPGSVAVRRTGT